jgi:hypothetical protein
MSAERRVQRFRVGEVPPVAEGFTDRPDTARGIVEALVPGATLALVPGSAFAEGPANWLGACGKTQIAVILAESLWRSGAIDTLIWISATSRASVLSAYVEASAAAFGIAPTGTAESVAARLVSWLATTDQQWLVVLDDLQDQTDLDGLWPEGPSGRVLVTGTQASLVSGRRGTQVIPVGFFSVREALNCLTERLSVNPAQRHGAIDLIEALGTTSPADGSKSAWRRARCPPRPPSAGRYLSAKPNLCSPARRSGSCWCWSRCSTGMAYPVLSSARRPCPGTWAAG